MKYAVYSHRQNGKHLGWYRVPMKGGRFLDRKLDWYSETQQRWFPSIYRNVRDLIDSLKNQKGGDMWLTVINVEFHK